MINSPRIILWCGNAPNQKALANRLAKELPISGIVIESHSGNKKKQGFKIIVKKIVSRFVFFKVFQSWNMLMKKYTEEYPEWPPVNILHTNQINDPEVLKFTSTEKPDLILVSGTRLIRKEMFNIPASIGYFNLHTGLSPYIKGGPNCTNWCIAEKKFHMIGNTIMWLDAGIDTGNLISTERVLFNGSETLAEIHIKVMNAAHLLYIKAAKLAISDKALVPNIPQKSISPGTTYYNKMWGNKTQLKLLLNLKFFRQSVRSGDLEKEAQFIETFPLPK